MGNIRRTIAAAGAPALDALAGAVRHAQAGDPFAPVIVVAPGLVPALHLRRGLARRGGIVGVEFMPLGAVAGRCTPLKSARPLGRAVWIEAVRLAVEREPGAFARVAHHPSAVRRIAGALARVRSASTDERALHASRGRRAADLQRILSIAERRVGARSDAAQVLRYASAAVSSGAHVGAPLVLYGHRRGAPAADAFVDALRAAGAVAGEVIVVVGDERADAAALDDAVDDVARRRPRPSRLLVAPDAATEAAIAAREVISAAHAGVPFGAMAVVALGDASCRARVAAALDAACIPWSGPPPAPLAAHPPARALLALIHLADGAFARDTVLRALSAGAVRRTAGAAALVPVDRWASLTARANVVIGADQWTTRLLRLSAGRPHDLDLAASVADLVEFFEELAHLVRPPASDSAWGEWVNWSIDLFARYLAMPHSDGAPPIDPAADGVQIIGRLRQLLDLDALGGRPDLRAFAAAVEEAFAAPPASRGTVGRDVMLRSLAEVQGAELDLLVVVGAVEGAIPRRRSEDPLVPDDELEGAGGGRSRHDQRREEGAALLLALAAAHSSVLCMHRSSGQAAARPSRWFLELAGALDGLAVRMSLSADDIAAEHPNRPWLRVVPSSAAMLADGSTWGGPAELRTASLLHWRAAHGSIVGHPLVVPGDVGLGADVIEARRARHLTRFTGLAGPGSRLPSPVSATTLESWTACPRRYFFARVLGLDPREATEDTLAFDARERGSLAHSAMERVVVDRLGDRLAPDEPWGERAAGVADAALLAPLEDLAARGRLGKGVLADLQVERLRAQVAAALLQDDFVRSEGRWVPTGAEVAFGGTDLPVAVVTPSGRSVPLHGRIDRVDRGWPPSRVRVVDVKTGRQSALLHPARDGSDAPRHLQLAVYAEASRQVLEAGSATDDVTAEWWVLGADEPTLVPNQLDAPAFGRVVDAIVDGVEAGVFPMDPGELINRAPSMCRFCAFDRICPSDRMLIAARTADDPIAEPLHRIRDPLHIFGGRIVDDS